MKTFTMAAAAALIILAAVSPATAQPKCNECHSKNPKLVNMHRALNFSGCADCHSGGVMFSKGDGMKRTPSGPLCMRCHIQQPPSLPPGPK